MDERLPALALGVGITVVCSLPVFLAGAMAVQVADDLQFGTVGIGAAVSAFFGAVALSSVYLGRLTDRIGATVSLRVAAVVSAMSCLGIAAVTVNWVSLAGWLILAGIGQALAQPAANRMLVHRVGLARLGTAFGIKQAAPPTASILAGLSVPALALTVGWRWAYVLSAVGAILLAGLLGRTSPTPRGVTNRTLPTSPRKPLRGRAALVILGTGFAIAFATSSVVLAFYVEAAVRAGASSGTAGSLFALGGVSVVVTRLAAGVACDRLRITPLHLSAALLVIGAVGIALLATNEQVPMAFGAVISLTGTWGFPGVFWFALVSAYPESPGRITGAIAPAATGGLVGPVGFGAIASTFGYPPAWRLAAVLALLAAIAFVIGAQRLTDLGAEGGPP